MNRIKAAAKSHPIVLGIILIFAFTWSIDFTLAAQARGWIPQLLPGWLGIFVGYGFILAAVLATALSDGRQAITALLRRFLIWRVHPIWYAVALLGPLALGLLALALARLAGLPAPDYTQPFVRTVIGVDPAIHLVWVALIWLLFEIFTNGEEIGWRGYLLPRLLARHNALVASLLLGALWAIWHLPKFWMGGASSAAHSYPFWLFALDIIAQSVLFTWLYQQSGGSLLLTTLLHAAHNTVFMCLPISMAIPNGAAPFMINIVLHCLCALAVGIYLVGKRTPQAAAGAPGKQQQPSIIAG